MRSFFVLALWTVLFASPALAQEPEPTGNDEAARTHFASGRVHFDEGEYEAALREFQSAYDLSHRDALLFNLYLAEERLGHLAEATDYLQRYLASDVVPDDQRPTLERRLENMRERLAAQSEAQASPAPVPERSHPLLVPGLVTLGIGAASLIAFAVVGGLALGEDGRLATTCGADAGRTCSDAEVSDLRSLSMGADIALSIGLVAAAVGGALLIVDLATDGEAAPQRTARLMPWGGPTGAGLVVEGAL